MRPEFIARRPASAGTAAPRERRPDAASEARLLDLRREAERLGRVSGAGVQPVGAPFPKASPQTGYYGVPLLKEPQWNWAVPLYFFVGGAAGAAAVVGNVADLAGDDYELACDARWIALGGAAVSGAILVYDLGRPARFLNMLRVFKPQSPMSMGAWILTAFSAHAAASKFADVLSERWPGLPVRVLSGAAKAGSIFWGMPFSNYTGVLIGATALPVWNRNVKTLPIHFGASGLQSAVSLLELWGHADSAALNWLGIAAAAYELWEGFHLERDAHPAQRPLKRGASGAIVRTGGVLSGPVPLLLRVAAVAAGKRNATTLRRVAALSGIAGSLLTRYGWMHAGHASAQDWRLPLEIDR
jgi:formate-dependent nitrite reductase membrane component NrfD